MKLCLTGGSARKDDVEAVIRLKTCKNFQAEEREDDDPYEVCEHCKIENGKGYCELTFEKVMLVAPDVLKQVVEQAKDALKYLRGKKKPTRLDRLSMEYLRTFINNPTRLNYILLSCGRAHEMKRKEEETDEQ